MSATMTTTAKAQTLTANLSLPRPADDPRYLAAAARGNELHAAKRKVELRLAEVEAEIDAGRRALQDATRRPTAVERAADAILAGGPDAEAVRSSMRSLQQRREELTAELEAHDLACRKHNETATTPALNAAARALAPAVLRETVAPATLAVEAAYLELGRALKHLDRVRDAVDAAGLERAVRVDLPFAWEDLDATDPASAAARYLADLRADGVLPERKPATGKAGK